MSEVLAQSDINALLDAVDSGVVRAVSESTQIFSRNRRDATGVEVRPYDFKRPERVSKDQMRSLQTLHEAFARNFGAALSGFLRTIVEVRVSSCDQLTYGEFISSLPNPTSFNLVDAKPLEGQVCLELSPLIIYPIIDRLLGGTNRDLFIPQRPLTVIETRLNNARTEIEHWTEYDFVVINDDLDRAFSEVRAIVTGERLRRDRRPGLFDFVSGLLDEKT